MDYFVLGISIHASARECIMTSTIQHFMILGVPFTYNSGQLDKQASNRVLITNY